jgi:P pilus assembly chaperone PapD
VTVKTSKHVTGALLFFLLAAPGVRASDASFGIKPDVATVDAKTPVAEFSVSSLSARATVFEVHVLRWAQTTESDSYTPAPMMIVPAVFMLSPYESRLIRIEPRGGPVQRDVEQSYRVTITEVVPGQTTPPPEARRFEAVLFIPPRMPSGEATFSITGSGKNALLTVTNASNHHVFLGRPRIAVGNNEILRAPNLGYVLAKSTRTFSLPLEGTIEAAGSELRFDDERGSEHRAALRSI